MKTTRSLCAAALVLACSLGCGTDRVARVTSNTRWSGAFDNRTVDGTGNQEVSLPWSGVTCCVVQKQTKEGYLRVEIVEKSRGPRWISGGDDFQDRAETSAEYGVVSVCGH